MIWLQMPADKFIRLLNGGIERVSSPEDLSVNVLPILDAAIKHSHMNQIPRILSHAMPCSLDVPLGECQVGRYSKCLQSASKFSYKDMIYCYRSGCISVRSRPCTSACWYLLSNFSGLFSASTLGAIVYSLAHIDCPYPGACP